MHGWIGLESRKTHGTPFHVGRRRKFDLTELTVEQLHGRAGQGVVKFLRLDGKGHKEEQHGGGDKLACQWEHSKRGKARKGGVSSSLSSSLSLSSSSSSS